MSANSLEHRRTCEELNVDEELDARRLSRCARGSARGTTGSQSRGAKHVKSVNEANKRDIGVRGPGRGVGGEGPRKGHVHKCAPIVRCHVKKAAEARRMTNVSTMQSRSSHKLQTNNERQPAKLL